jgi:uncharacterized protein
LNKIFLILFTALSLQVAAQKSLQKPFPQRLVVDNANVISAYDEAILEKKLVALDDSTSNQICVVTVNSLNNEIIEEVANKTYRDWGIGNKKTNNGILLLVAIKDRKVRIEVGYGLEGAIPDITANHIINNDIKPAFKQGNYLGGINAAVDNLIKAAAGEYHTQREKNSSSNRIGSIAKIIFIIIIIVIIMASNSRGSGGNGYRRSNASDFILPILFNSGGWGGGSFGGGDNDSGGGFGGFGGGSSGGGGASGSW